MDIPSNEEILLFFFFYHPPQKGPLLKERIFSFRWLSSQQGSTLERANSFFKEQTLFGRTTGMSTRGAIRAQQLKALLA